MDDRDHRATLTRDHVRRVAELARLELSEEELTTYTTQLRRVLDHVARLEALDVTGVASTAHAVDLLCPLREDEVRPSTDREAILGQASEHDGTCFVVPRVLREP
jgi:aspartyl-tRNA(Asn)/glutamyl-tRNA(Gln) amidotransferase subunit C